MSKPSWFKGKTLLKWRHQAKQVRIIVNNSNILFFAIALVIFAMMTNLWYSQTTSYAYAYTGSLAKDKKPVSSLFENKSKLFDGSNKIDVQGYKPSSQMGLSNEEVGNYGIQTSTVGLSPATEAKSTKMTFLLEHSNNDKTSRNAIADAVNSQDQDIEKREFERKLYEVVGDTPIKEMVPFISKRNEKVAAFLVGIAKKESSFGLSSPSKNGESCYNFWGYKGIGERGTGMGYACFASAEEAVNVVGDRIEMLVNKQRNTPARMVDTWKCGTSCEGDAGASGWVATVALYFEKIVS